MTIATHSATRHVVPNRGKVWTPELIHDLGVTTGIETAGASSASGARRPTHSHAAVTFRSA